MILEITSGAREYVRVDLNYISYYFKSFVFQLCGHYIIISVIMSYNITHYYYYKPTITQIAHFKQVI